MEHVICIREGDFCVLLYNQYMGVKITTPSLTGDCSAYSNVMEAVTVSARALIGASIATKPREARTTSTASLLAFCVTRLNQQMLGIKKYDPHISLFI